MTTLFYSIFTAALALTLLLKLWLGWSQIQHIAQNRHSVPAEFANHITLQQHQLAADYTIAKTRLSLYSALLEVAIILVLTLGGLLQWSTTIISSLTSSPMMAGILLISAATIFCSLLNLPLSLYSTFGVESRFGFNKITLKLYIIDQLKKLLLAIIIGLPLLTLTLWLMEITGPLWWFWVWLVWAAVQLLIAALFPTWIAPLFNTFSPLLDQALATRIESLLQRTGFASQGIFIMDNSRRSSHGNAYFTGFGKTKRIVFFDTLLAQLNHNEIEAVLAHELGHFKHRHVLKRIMLTFILSLGLLWLLGQLLHALWFYHALGVQTPSTAMALILFFMVIPLFTFPLTPLFSLLSRKNEYEADRFACEQTQSSFLISALVKLYRDNASTLTPDTLYSTFYDAHPPAMLRIQHIKEHAQ